MSFKAQVDKWVLETKERMEAVTRSAIGDLIEEAQRPGPSRANPGMNKGGKMPVDTGFLRASGMSNLNSMPIGPSKRENNEPNSYPSPNDYVTTPKVTVDLARMTYSDDFYFGWTAEYARAIEARYAFVDAAIQNWQQYVNNRANELMRRSK